MEDGRGFPRPFFFASLLRPDQGALWIDARLLRVCGRPFGMNAGLLRMDQWPLWINARLHRVSTRPVGPDAGLHRPYQSPLQIGARWARVCGRVRRPDAALLRPERRLLWITARLRRVNACPLWVDQLPICVRAFQVGVLRSGRGGQRMAAGAESPP